MESTPKLKVGALVRAREIPAWQHAVLQAITTGRFGELVVVAVAGATPAHPQRRSTVDAALRRVLARLDANIACERDPLAASDVTTLQGARIVDCQGAARQIADALSPFALDVILDFATASPDPNLASAARHGAWKLTQPYSASADTAEAAFWPVYRGWPTAEIVLERHTRDGGCSELGRSMPAVHPLSLKLTQAAVCWRAASLVVHTLEQLHAAARGESAVAEPREPTRASAPSAREAGPLELATYAVRNVARRARASASRRLTLDQWILLFRLGDSLSTSPAEFTRIVPPRTCFWADPHVIERFGRFYAFIEECPFETGRGHIAVMTIERDGTWSTPVPALVRDYHLSYPFVFEHEGELYMVPESEANRTIDLYRCVDFPARWEHVTTLIERVAATDSTLLRHDGRWWLFANVLDMPGASFSEELSIFSSESLTGGTWKPHPRNPVVSDARRARPAGAIIRRNGRLLRPAQDCSLRYGYGIRLHEIERLSEGEFVEREIERIEPSWDGRIAAVHTLSHVPGLTMMDALQPRLRL